MPGLYPPSSGTAIVNGFSITSNIDAVRHSLVRIGQARPRRGVRGIGGLEQRVPERLTLARTQGICPQHDILFDTLTVEEHLQFFCKLKGMPVDQIQQEVDSMIEVELEEACLPRVGSQLGRLLSRH
jgi:ATP-binding cassette subfamily A (ABC1) protein 3